MAPETYAVIGIPLGHSVSPAMQQAAFDHLGIDASYKALETRPEDLEQRVKDVRRGSLAGLNVTIPHKTRAVEYLDATAPTATRTGAVNTIFWRDGALTGENTDVPAIAGGLDRAGVSRSARGPLIGGGGGGPAREASPLPEGALGREQFVFDMVYRPERTPLIERAQAAGCIWVGGLDM